MELSMRMKQVADMVEPCKTVADVGCDHGYVSIYLIKQGIAEQVIAMDVRKGPLSRAEQNVQQEQLTGQITCRLSDGLEKLTYGEADAIVIAGMGGPLMIRILEQGAAKRQGTELLVLQPQSDIPAVRRYLHKIGYEIIEEAMLREDGKYYTVLKGVPQVHEEWSPVAYQYGKYLLESKSKILMEFLAQESQVLGQIRDSLRTQQTEKSRERLEELTQQLEWNQEAQRIYETENHHELA
ncbi:MAG: SAM-dependent methyltransferase [Lachnospiraceae bacterium]|nr:SAM-dependent methyltransferase [Lachnospiraceae bacterium]